MKHPGLGLGRWTAVLSAAALALTVGSAPTAEAVALPTIVTSANYLYLPPDVTIRRGTAVNYVNVDIGLHNVTALATRNGEPLFFSDTISAGETTPVIGVAALEPGVYDYTCTLHTFMLGSITVRD